MREGLVRAPELVEQVLVLHRHGDTVEEGELVWRAVDRSFRTRAVVAADVDDQRVVKFAHILNRLDDAADFMVGVSQICREHVGLLDKEFLLLQVERIPFGQLLGPCSQFRVLRDDAQFLLVGEDGFAQLVPAILEQVHVADLLDPFFRGMMRRVYAAGHVINEERLVGCDFVQPLHIFNGLVGHGRGQIPFGVSLKRVNRRRIAEQVRRPLARIPADEAVEILEAHPVGPLIERSGHGRFIERCVVVLAEPRRRVAVLFENFADGAALAANDGIVARITGCRFPNDAETIHVMIASCDQRRACRRAEGRRVEPRITQSAVGDAIQGWRWDHSAERARRAKPAIVCHDQEHVGRALGRHDTRRPPRLRLRRLQVDRATEFRVRRRKLIAWDRRGGARTAHLAGHRH